MRIRLGSREVGDGAPTFVVAEMAWSHDGSRDHARRIVGAAAAARADAVNFHVTSLPDYMVPGYTAGLRPVADGSSPTIYERLADLSLHQADWKALSAEAHDLGLLVSCMCNDFPSLDFALSDLSADLLMIHPSCISDPAFVASVARTRLPVVLYVGGLTPGEIDEAVRISLESGNDRLVLQHGFQGYPTPIEENHLAALETLKRLWGFPVAFGDHTAGDDPLALVVPLLAIAKGADVVEKHLTYDRSVRGTDYESALDPATFATFVAWVRAAERTFGSSALRPLSEREQAYRRVVRKRAVAGRTLRKGSVLREEDVVYKRSDAGLYPREVLHLFGRSLREDLPKDAPITWDAVE